MNLYARIKGHDYAVANGATFTNTVTETLESGSISIPHVREIDIKPYDDVFIHDYKPNVSVTEGGLPTHGSGVTRDELLKGNTHFYKHMLASDITRQQVTLDDGDYNYTIQLISETKGLEFIQLPNVNIFPTSDENAGRNLGDTVERFLELYSTYDRVAMKSLDDKGAEVRRWKWQRKYTLSSGTMEFLNKAKCPEMNFQGPNLREVLNSLFHVVDCLPYVFNGIIYHVSLSDRNGSFELAHDSWETWGMSGSEYCDRLMRFHSQSLSRDSRAHIVEKIGFRCTGSDTLTLSNLSLEFSHPIYRINKILMCYYENFGSDSDPLVTLIKQDITPLVLLNQQRAILSIDWSSYNKNGAPSTINGYTRGGKYFRGLADYKISTIGYSVGSDTITGWGEKYSWPTLWGGKNYSTYIENLIKWFRNNSPLGCDYQKAYFSDEQNGENNIVRMLKNQNPTIIVPWDATLLQTISDKITNETTSNGIFTHTTQVIKNLIFEVEYEPFISSCVVASKEFHDGNVVKRDNPEGSLPYVERDGVAEREKANRLGNATVTRTGRVNSVADIRPDVLLRKTYGDDMVLYQYSYVVMPDHMSVTYYFAKDYIVRNYFNSVFSKRRPFEMASYGESVERTENKTIELFVSPDKIYRQAETRKVKTDSGVMKRLVNFWEDTRYTTDTGLPITDGSVNVAYLMDWGGTGDDASPKFYAMDTLNFMSGNSLCFEMRMTDSVSMGNYIYRSVPKYDEYLWKSVWGTLDVDSGSISSAQQVAYDSISGSLQDWLMLNTDSTGGIDRMSFGVGRMESASGSDVFMDNSMAVGSGNYDIGRIRGIYTRLGEFPLNRIDKVSGSENASDTGGAEHGNYDNTNDEAKDLAKTGKLNVDSYLSAWFGDRKGNGHTVYKDGKETMNVTLQVEPVADDGIFIGENFLALSDIIGAKEKRNSSVQNRRRFLTVLKTSTYILNLGEKNRDTSKPMTYKSNLSCCYPAIMLSIPKEFPDFNYVNDVTKKVSKYVPFSRNYEAKWAVGFIRNFKDKYGFHDTLSYTNPWDARIVMKGVCRRMYSTNEEYKDESMVTIVADLYLRKRSEYAGTDTWPIKSPVMFNMFITDSSANRKLYASNLPTPIDGYGKELPDGSSRGETVSAVTLDTVSTNMEGYSCILSPGTVIGLDLDSSDKEKETAWSDVRKLFTEDPFSVYNGYVLYDDVYYFDDTNAEIVGGTQGARTDSCDTFARDLTSVNSGVGKPRRRNIFWVLRKDTVTEDTIYSERQYDTERDYGTYINVDELNDGNHVLGSNDMTLTYVADDTIVMNSAMPTGWYEKYKSVAMYYVEDNGRMRFTFGINFKGDTPEEIKKNYNITVQGKEYLETGVFMSLMDTRSLSVIDENGDRTKKIRNYRMSASNPSADNYDDATEDA